MSSKKSLEKRKYILDNFLDLVAEQGFNRVTLKDVAKKSGLTKSGVYYYFKSKEDLLLETINLMYTEIKALMEKNVKPVKDPVVKLKKYIELKLAFLTDESLALSCFTHFSMEVLEEIEKFLFDSPELIKRFAEISFEDKGVLKNILYELYKGKNVDESYVEQQARILMILIDGFYHSMKQMDKLDSSMREMFVPDVKKAAKQIAEILTKGIQ